MKRIIFNSKKLYTANLSVSSIFFLITVLSLYPFIVGDEQRKDLILYVGYFIIYISSLLVLLLKTKNAIVYLHIIYSFAIVLNIIDFSIHYSKYHDLISKSIFIITASVLITIFSLLIYFNNKYQFRFNASELDEIGKL
jgi:uncharacterized membrane protein